MSAATDAAMVHCTATADGVSDVSWWIAALAAAAEQSPSTPPIPERVTPACGRPPRAKLLLGRSSAQKSLCRVFDVVHAMSQATITTAPENDHHQASCCSSSSEIVAV